MKDETWYRHANPWSGWSRILSYPIIYIPVWFLQEFIANPAQNWYVILGFILVAVWYAINPRIFPKPKNYDSWISKGVLGEKAWTKIGVKDINFAFGVVSAIFFIPAVIFCYFKDFWPMMFFGAVAILLKMWFLERMVSYYEAHREEIPPPPTSEPVVRA